MQMNKLNIKGNTKRQAIIEAAKALSLEKGLYSWTLQDVADRAGLHVGNMYYYVKAKEELQLLVTTLYKLDDPTRLLSDFKTLEEQRLYIDSRFFWRDREQKRGESL